MGKFQYNSAPPAEIDDRLLLHLQVVIGSKLRRGEAFPFSWIQDRTIGGGRVTVWLSPASTIVYRFSGSRVPSLNGRWLDALSQAANSPAGLYLVREPDSVTSSIVAPADEYSRV